jgi:uncharacterized protein DUF993
MLTSTRITLPCADGTLESYQRDEPSPWPEAAAPMMGGQQSARSILNLAEVLRLADRAKLPRDPELASRRMQRLPGAAGVGA